MKRVGGGNRLIVWENAGAKFFWAHICKRLKSPGIDSKESISPALAWLADTSNRGVVPARQVGNQFLGSIKGLQIRALYTNVQ